MKTLKLTLLALLVLAALAVACGGGAAAPTQAPAAAPTQPPAAAPTQAPAAAQPTQAPATGGAVSLTYWSGWNENEPQATVEKEWMADYTKAHPNVTFNVTWAGRQVLTKLQTAVSAGQKVDIIEMEGPALRGGLVVHGLTLPMDKYLAQNAEGENVSWKDVFVPGLLDALKATDGSTHVIPYEILTVAFWYDQRVFDKYGLQPAKTFDDITAMCKKTAAQNFSLLVVEGHTDVYNAMWYYYLSERMLGPGALFKAATDKTGAAWDNPAFLQMAQMERSLWDAGCFAKGAEGVQWPAGQMGLATGKLGMELVGSWLPNEVKDSTDPAFAWHSFFFPNVPGGKGKQTDVEVYPFGWVVSKDTANPDVAADFLRFSLTKTNAQKIPDTAVNLSARKDTTPPKALADAWAGYSNATGYFLPYDGINAFYSEYYSTIFEKYHGQMFLGQLSPADFIKTMKQSTIDYWTTHQP